MWAIAQFSLLKMRESAFYLLMIVAALICVFTNTADPVSEQIAKGSLFSYAFSGDVRTTSIAMGSCVALIISILIASFYGSSEIPSDINTGVILLQPEAKELEEVVVTGRAMRTSAKGDTIIYNADAFKVTQDASTEQLLAKMPGVRVVDGTVEAHGETVQKDFIRFLQDQAGHFKMAGSCIFRRRHLQGPAIAAVRRSLMRKVQAVNVIKAQLSQIGDIKARDCLNNMPERMYAFIAIIGRIRQRTYAEAV